MYYKCKMLPCCRVALIRHQTLNEYKTFLYTGKHFTISHVTLRDRLWTCQKKKNSVCLKHTWTQPYLLPLWPSVWYRMWLLSSSLCVTDRNELRPTSWSSTSRFLTFSLSVSPHPYFACSSLLITPLMILCCASCTRQDVTYCCVCELCQCLLSVYSASASRHRILCTLAGRDGRRQSRRRCTCSQCGFYHSSSHCPYSLSKVFTVTSAPRIERNIQL